jgi:hypothetical protein
MKNFVKYYFDSAVIDRVFDAVSPPIVALGPQFHSIRCRVVTDATDARGSASYGDMLALGPSSHGGVP